MEIRVRCVIQLLTLYLQTIPILGVLSVDTISWKSRLFWGASMISWPVLVITLLVAPSLPSYRDTDLQLLFSWRLRACSRAWLIVIYSLILHLAPCRLLAWRSCCCWQRVCVVNLLLTMYWSICSPAYSPDKGLWVISHVYAKNRRATSLYIHSRSKSWRFALLRVPSVAYYLSGTLWNEWEDCAHLRRSHIVRAANRVLFGNIAACCTQITFTVCCTYQVSLLFIPLNPSPN